ncbi:hypothetical protein FV544_13170 [Salmonella enterica]|nr:hypothetical protein [Salmonella enterica]EEK6337445.1 hypothetical protein [Salmonella enterica]EFU1646628.1 hypothetical protein [Salmonella enterica]
MQPGIIDIAHFGVIAVNIDNAIRAADESAVTVADVYTRCAAVKSTITRATNTDAFCRVERFF